MSRIFKGIFGGSSSSERILQRFRPAGFAAGGATGTFNQGTNTFTVGRTPERDAAVGGVVRGFRDRAASIRDLRSQVTPGFGRLSEIRREGLRGRLNALRAERTRTVGNIREGLARRRLQGSSFEQSEVSRAEAGFAREADLLRADANEAEAGAFLQEIALNSDFIAQEFDSVIAGAQTVLQDLNLDTALAASMSGHASALMAANITSQAEARAAQQAAGESFLDNILGIFLPTGKKAA